MYRRAGILEGRPIPDRRARSRWRVLAGSSGVARRPNLPKLSGRLSPRSPASPPLREAAPMLEPVGPSGVKSQAKPGAASNPSRSSRPAVVGAAPRGSRSHCSADRGNADCSAGVGATHRGRGETPRHRCDSGPATSSWWPPCSSPPPVADVVPPPASLETGGGCAHRATAVSGCSGKAAARRAPTGWSRLSPGSGPARVLEHSRSPIGP
jgi:hypothetical protein